MLGSASLCKGWPIGGPSPQVKAGARSPACARWWIRLSVCLSVSLSAANMTIVIIIIIVVTHHVLIIVILP